MISPASTYLKNAFMLKFLKYGFDHIIILQKKNL
jgi:hypothetical protein